MAQLHLVTAHRSIQRADAPHVVYCGRDADQAKRKQAAILEGGLFALADLTCPDRPVTKYAEPKILEKIAGVQAEEAAAKAKQAAADAAKAQAAAEKAEAASEKAQAAKASGGKPPAEADAKPEKKTPSK